MLSKHLRILNISDIHLGHNNTKTEFIINNIYSFFTDYKKVLRGLDVIIISGDIFDRLLPNNSKEYNLIIEWLSNLSKYCTANGIKLRILEGTPSHDFKQLRSFNTILSKLHIDVDFKYFDKITIENIKEYNMNILYIPDEANETAEDTYIEVQNLMKESKLSKVDLIVMHGQFHYHLPAHNTPVSHIEENYLKLTDNYILCGHIHKHSTYDRILTPGSMDRLAQNEEERKGGLLISLNNGVNEYVFLENTKAKRYKTLKYNVETIDNVMEDIASLRLPDDSYLRIKISKKSNLKNNTDIVKRRFKHLNIKIEYNEEPTVTRKTIIQESINEISITKSNILKLLDKELEPIDIKTNIKEILMDELKAII